MATTVKGVAQVRRVVQPKYEFDPDAVYTDPEVQAWATYYAHGGSDPAGIVHFISVPGLTDGDLMNSSTTHTRPSLTIDTNFPSPPVPKSVRADSEDLEYLRGTYGIMDAHPANDVTVKYDFEPRGYPDELAVKSGTTICVIHKFDDQWSLVKNEEGKRGMVPCDCLMLEDSSTVLRLPGPRSPSSLSRLTPVRSPVSIQDSKRKSRKSVLGLLELLHITKRKQKEEKPNVSLASRITPFNPDSERRTPRSALKKSRSTSVAGKDSESLRKVRFDSTLTETFEFDRNTYSLIPSVASSESNEERESDVSDIYPDPSIPPPYEEVFARHSPPVTPTEKTSWPLPVTESTHTNLVSGSKTPEGVKVHFEVYVESSESTDVTSPDPSLAKPVALLATPSLSEGVASQSIIYRNLLSLLITEVSSTDPLRATLHEYLAFLQTLDRVSSLLQSRDYRANLLQVASALNISEDQRIREALQKDEHEIADTLHAISQSEASRQAVLALEGDNAQKFLDVVQDVLDKAYLLNHEDNARARRLLIRLSETCNKLPSSLFIKGVERLDDQATFGGGFGDVYRASYNGQCVALKRMRIFQRDPGLPNIRRRFCKEALIWQQLKSTFIVPFFGIDAETFPSFLCMVSPWMRHGTVLKHLADHGRGGVDKRLNEVAQGLAYLHSQKVVHGDLRGSNILINDQWQACLTDFGLTVFDDATALTFTSRREGSVRWMAPELHDPESFGLDRFRLTPETDIYAFGCVCLELYTGRPPFADILRDPAVMYKVIQGGRPDRPTGEKEMSDQLWKMVEMCWSQHFADRLKTEEVVEFTKRLTDPNTKFIDLPVFSEVPKSLLPSSDDENWDELDKNAAEDKLVKSSPATALYLQQDLTLSEDSLFTESLPPSPLSLDSLFTESPFPSPLLLVKPLPTYLPSPDDSPIVYCSDEEKLKDDEDNSSMVYLDDETVDIIQLPPTPPSRDSSLSKLSQSVFPEKPGLPEELNEYWDIIHKLDVALDVDFSFDSQFVQGQVLKLDEPTTSSKPSTVSISFIFLLTISFAFYFLLYSFVLLYLMFGRLLVRPVMIGRM